MATIALTNAYLSVGGTDLSAHVKSVSIDYSAAELDDTAMGDSSTSRIAGLKDWSVSVEFNQDYAAGAVDATLFSLVGAAAFAVIVKPNGGTTSATNPSFTGNAILTGYNPVSGAVGDLAAASASFAGSGTLARATS